MSELNEARIRAAKPKERLYKLRDGRGLRLLITHYAERAALRRLGFGSDEQTAHGFRSIASTLLNELGHPPDVIELQKAHKKRNKVRAAYDRAQRLDERRKMIQAWSHHLDSLRDGANVVRLKRAG